MNPFAALSRPLLHKIAGNRTDLKAIAFEVKLLRAHVNELVIGTQNIRQSNRHLQDLKFFLHVVAGLRIRFIHNRFRQFLAGFQIQPHQP